jgi:hypothetical protein
MTYGLPNFSSKTPLSAAALNQITRSIDWQHDRTPYCFDLSGNLISSANGIGEVVGKLDVDPASYPGYIGHPGTWGQFNVTLPAGLFVSLISLEIQAASGSNGAMTATVRGETTSGFTVFVNDPGGTTITPFAIWIYAKGKLSPGRIP